MEAHNNIELHCSFSRNFSNFNYHVHSVELDDSVSESSIIMWFCKHGFRHDNTVVEKCGIFTGLSTNVSIKMSQSSTLVEILVENLVKILHFSTSV